jgi:hypothetical protein
VSQLKDIADALAASLALYEFTAVADQPVVDRRNWPSYDVDDLKIPVIAVNPGGIQAQRVSRPSTFEYDYELVVFLGRHTPTEAQADAMLDMAEELMDVIRQHDWDEAATWPTGVTSPMTVEIELNPDEALQDRNVWRAILTVSYKVHRT